MMLAAAVVVGCSFDLAGRGTDLAVNGDSSVVGSGPRVELFVVDPLQVSVDEASGGTATVTIRLAQAPSAPVIIPTRVSPQGRITVEPGSLTFTPENFGTSQTLTLSTTRNNELDPPDFMLEIGPAASSDSLFNGADPNDVKIAFQDATKDVIVISPRATPTGADFMVAEDVTSTAKFFVSLAAQPTDAVTITLRVPPGSVKDIRISGVDSVPDAGVDAGDAFGISVTMTFPADTPVGVSKPLIVRGVDDGKFADGDATALVTFDPATSGDKRFSGQVAKPLQLFARDNDVAGVFYVKSAVVTTEPGATDTFDVTLGTQPTGTITVDVTSSDTSEGTVSPAVLMFNNSDWNKPHRVTVTGVQDTLADGPVGYTITLGKPQPTPSDPAYADPKLVALDIPATNYDDEAIATVVGPNPLATGENGLNSSFTVSLKYPIVGAVQLDVTSNNTGEATVSPATLTFSANNWSQPQTVNVFGVNDPRADGPQNFAVNLGVSTGPNTAEPYKGSAAVTVNGINADDDVASVLIAPTALTVAEGGSDQFTVRLTSEPVAPVNILLSASTTGVKPPVVSFSPSSPQLTSANWSTGVVVTVSIADDCWAQKNTTFGVTTSVSTTDGAYAGKPVPDLTGVHVDTDVPSLAVSSNNVTISNGSTNTSLFQVIFATRPLTAVTVPLSIASGASKITLNTSSISVSTNGGCPVAFPVSVKGTQTGTFSIDVGPVSGTEPDYSGLTTTVNGTVN